jgi:predicted transposase/invertase (TIGR01784 family)
VNCQVRFLEEGEAATLSPLLDQQSPELLFQLLEQVPDKPEAYRFNSVAVKEPKFEIDGVFLPPEGAPNGIVYFCEVQFQKDLLLYERLFGESLLYFFRNRELFADWRAVIIYPSRKMEQSRILPYEDLVYSHRTTRIYLDELGDIETLPIGVALMVLTTIDEAEAPQVARDLLQRSDVQDSPSVVNRAIIEMISIIMTYKFISMSRQEIEAMLDITIQETRVYRDAKEEGRQEGKKEGKREGKREGKKEGKKEGQLSLVLLLLKKQLGKISPKLTRRIQALSLEESEALAIALLQFKTMADLETWLAEQSD